MKKILVLSCAAVFLVACSDSDPKNSSDSSNPIVEKESSKSKLTIESFKQAYENEGITVDSNEKPLYDMIKAKDGVIFYQDQKPVKIYEFESENAIKEAKKNNEFIKDWPENGNFVLETSNEKAIEIFNSVK